MNPISALFNWIMLQLASFFLSLVRQEEEKKPTPTIKIGRDYREANPFGIPVISEDNLEEVVDHLSFGCVAIEMTHTLKSLWMDVASISERFCKNGGLHRCKCEFKDLHGPSKRTKMNAEGEAFQQHSFYHDLRKTNNSGFCQCVHKAVPDGVILGYRLELICKQILECILRHFDVPEDLWEKITGNILCDIDSDSPGRTTFSSHHYLTGVKGAKLGLPAHKDVGFISAVISTSEGLEIKVGNQWFLVEHTGNHVIINFGAALEEVFGNDRIHAIEHRVALVDKYRFTAGVFVDSTDEAPLHRGINGEMVPHPVYGKPGGYGQYIRDYFMGVFKSLNSNE